MTEGGGGESVSERRDVRKTQAAVAGSEDGRGGQQPRNAGHL